MKKEKNYYLITALIAFGLLFFIYTQIDAFHNTFLISDSYSQYAAFFTKLRDFLLGKGSILYSFQGGLGNSFLGTFFYYLCSPFNILIVFFKDIGHFLLAITAIKLVCASLTALYFFRYHFKTKNPLYAITFSLLYLFISFTTHYFIHPMWLDSVLILPLLLVGIDKFLKEKKILLYLFSLFYVIVTNYYYGYMACLFSFFYFCYQLLNQYSLRKDIKKIAKQGVSFLGITLLGILCTSFALFPVLEEVSGYARTNTQFMNGETFIFKGNPISFISRFLAGSNSDIDFLNADQFYLYMGVLGIVLILLYYANGQISRKEKGLTTIMLLILYLSVSTNYGNYAWTAFSKPQYFNGRFPFFFNLFFLGIAFKSLVNLSHLSLKRIVIAFLIGILYFILFEFTENKTFLMYINLSLFLVYFFLLYHLNSKRIYVPFILASFAIIEVSLNAIYDVSEYGFTAKEEYQEQNLLYQYTVKTIENQDQSPFYRIENSETVPYNGPIYYGYYGIDIFASTLSNDIADFFWEIGYGSGETKKNTISYYSGNEVMDSLLGIKYHLFIEEDNVPSTYELIDSKKINDKKIRIYRNPSALSLGYMVNDKILGVEKNQDALMYQEAIISSMTDNRYSIYQHIPLEEKDGNYFYTTTKRGTTCFYTAIDSTNGYNNATIYVNDRALHKKYDFEIVCSNDIYENEIEISYSNLVDSQHLGTYAAFYSSNEFQKAIHYLQENELEIDDFENTYISGTVKATEEKNILFTTIPYHKNWKVYVNGKEVETIKVLDHLLGVKLEEGEWQIEFKYEPKSFYLGLLVSFLSFLILFLFQKKTKKKIISSLSAIKNYS